MSEHMFGTYRGHLSVTLIKNVEDKFKVDRVSVINFTEPRGEKRGWFSCRNRGEPFDSKTAREVMAYARSVARSKADREALGCDEVAS